MSLPKPVDGKVSPLRYFVNLRSLRVKPEYFRSYCVVTTPFQNKQYLLNMPITYQLQP
jgi:hypothetical protein